MLAIIIVSAIIGVLALALFISHFLRPNPNTRSQRVVRLTAALNKAIGTIEGIRREVEEGQALLEKIKSDTEVNRGLAGLSEEQSEAVWRAFGVAIRRENRRQLPVNLATQVLVGIRVPLVGGILTGHFALG